MNDNSVCKDSLLTDGAANPDERIVMRPFDKNGIPIYPKDVIKVFHFIGARRKKHYMYKQIDREENGCLIVKHLSSEGEYMLAMNGKSLNDYEIVQGYGGVKNGQSFEDRKRIGA